MRDRSATSRWLRLLAVLVGLGMIAAACGDDDDSAGGDDGNGDNGDNGGVEDTLPEDVDGDPQPGGDLVYALEAETSGGFCLAEAQLAISGMQVVTTLYDTLTRPDADGNIQPHLADSVEANDDFTEWTITLPEGITFHDGSALDAQVVANNIDAYRGAYEARSPLLFRFVFQDIESVEVVDPTTVQVNMARPWVAFDWFLWGSNRIGIMAQAQLDSENCGTEMIGTGPFTLDSWTTGEQMRTVKNPDYWATDDDGTQLPYLDSITYRPIPDSNSRSNAIESGQVQMMHTSNTEQIGNRLQPLADNDELKLLATDDYGEVNFLMLNAREAPFDNKNARLALAHALDYELLIEVRGAGVGQPATGPFQRGVDGYLEDSGYPTYDPTLAEEYAQAYEDETGEALTFQYSFVTDEANQLTAQEIQTQMGEVGIRVSLNPSGDQATTINAALSGDFQAMGWRNHPGSDPDGQYNWWYEDSPVNFGGFADPEINRLLDEGRTTPPGPERVEIYEDLNRHFAEEVWNIWTTTAVWAIGAQPEVQNVIGYGPKGQGDAFPGVATGHDVSGIWLSR